MSPAAADRARDGGSGSKVAADSGSKVAADSESQAAGDHTTPRPGSADATATSPDRDRAQTAIDYAIGITVFLLVVAFVFAFVPTTFAPFSGDDGRLMVLADRTADHLTDDLLVRSPSDPGVFNATCTTGFFDSDGQVPTGCRYDEDGTDLQTALGIDAPGVHLNVTLEREGAIASLDGTELAAGDDPRSRADVNVARRLALLEDRQYRVYVRVW